MAKPLFFSLKFLKLWMSGPKFQFKIQVLQDSGRLPGIPDNGKRSPIVRMREFAINIGDVGR